MHTSITLFQVRDPLELEYLVGFIFCLLKKWRRLLQIRNSSIYVLVIRYIKMSINTTYPFLYNSLTYFILYTHLLKIFSNVNFIGHNKVGNYVWEIEIFIRDANHCNSLTRFLISDLSLRSFQYRILRYYKENSSSILLIQCSNTIKQIK